MSHHSRPIRLGTALLLVLGTLLLRSAVSPSPANAVAPLPVCNGVYLDIMASHISYDDWALSEIDTIYRLPSSYAPPDLVAVSGAGLSGGGSVRSLLIPDLATMAAAAAAAGAPLAVQSAYRSYSDQVSTFNYWVSVVGYQAALLASARPGHSEHQLGTAIDFRSLNGSAPWNYSDWGTTAAGVWMRTHAWEYGFVMSYPAGISPSSTCYQYEPWHFRYVGRAEAAAIHAAGGNVRAWLWANGGANDTLPGGPTPTPVPTATPTPVITPTPVPTATPTPTPVTTPTPAPTATPTTPPPTPTPTPVTTPTPGTTLTPTPTPAAPTPTLAPGATPTPTANSMVSPAPSSAITSTLTPAPAPGATPTPRRTPIPTLIPIVRPATSSTPLSGSGDTGPGNGPIAVGLFLLGLLGMLIVALVWRFRQIHRPTDG